MQCHQLELEMGGNLEDGVEADAGASGGRVVRASEGE